MPYDYDIVEKDIITLDSNSKGYAKVAHRVFLTVDFCFENWDATIDLANTDKKVLIMGYILP